MKKLLLRVLLTWVLFIPLAITNGIAREILYEPFVGDLFAHQISTVIAIAAYVTLAYVMLRRVVAGATTQQLLGIGLLWVVMTICFEFSFGHYVDGAPWEQLLADYNLLEGHVWGLFLVAILLTPIIVQRLARR